VLEDFRFPTIKGKVCRVLPYSISFAKVQSKEVIQEKSGYIFAKGLPKGNYTHADLFKLFTKFGKIQSAKLSIDKDHQSKGFGYV
jgi:RNA recognition motif-containing protein